MRRISAGWMALGLCVVSMVPVNLVQAEVMTVSAFQTLSKEKAAGGQGVLTGKYAFTRDHALPQQAIREISWLTLPPGASIGYHPHAANEDAYIIVSGTGIFKDADGKDYPVGPGDVTIVRKGGSHGLSNSGSVPLVFLDVIAQQ